MISPRVPTTVVICLYILRMPHASLCSASYDPSRSHLCVQHPITHTSCVSYLNIPFSCAICIIILFITSLQLFRFRYIFVIINTISFICSLSINLYLVSNQKLVNWCYLFQFSITCTSCIFPSRKSGRIIPSRRFLLLLPSSISFLSWQFSSTQFSFILFSCIPFSFV